MTQQTRGKDPDRIEILPPEHPEVQALIAYLKTRSEQDYGEALADCIMDPNSVEVAAFRAPEMRKRSLIGCQYLLDHARSVMRNRSDEDASNKFLKGATERFIANVKREQRIIETQIAGDLADKGILSRASNPRSRALRRLKQRHVAEYQELWREEVERDKEKKRQQKAEARKARRAMDHAGARQPRVPDPQRDRTGAAAR